LATLAETFPVYKLRLGRLQGPPVWIFLPPPIVFGLLLTSTLGCYSDSCSCLCSDATQTPTHESSSSNSIQTSAHLHARTLLELPLMSVLGRSSDSHSRPHSDTTWTPAHNPTQSSVSICATNSRYSTQTSAWASARTSMSQFVLQVWAHTFRPRSDLRPHPHYSCIYKSKPLSSNSILQAHAFGPRLDLRPHPHYSCISKSKPLSSNSTLWAHAFGPRLDLRPCPRYNPNPCHPTLLGHPCLTPSYKFEPIPSGPARTSILVHVMSAVQIWTAGNISALHHCPAQPLIGNELCTRGYPNIVGFQIWYKSDYQIWRKWLSSSLAGALRPPPPSHHLWANKNMLILNIILGILVNFKYFISHPN
jgi:hypothetical protein